MCLILGVSERGGTIMTVPASESLAGGLAGGLAGRLGARVCCQGHGSSSKGSIWAWGLGSTSVGVCAVFPVYGFQWIRSPASANSSSTFLMGLGCWSLGTPSSVLLVSGFS